MLQSYSKQSLCIDPKSRRAFPQYILTIYGHKLYDVTMEEVVQWEKERGPIEWVRTNKHLGSNSYYEMKGGLSILAIIQIAFIIGNDTLIFICPLPQRSRVLNQLEKNKISNVKLLNETSPNEALSSRIVITDNQELIKTCVDKNFTLNGGLVLGFFTAKRNESVAAMRRLYIKNQLREIVTPNANTECAGFQYQHYFWNSWNPNGFYQIRPSKYIIYTFWGDSPQKLNSRKKFLIQQMVKMDVEVKIISPQGFLYFQVQGTPIHPAFFLLTSTHKSDYFRVYLMHHYGGAYADVKHTHFQWKPFFEKLQKDQAKYAYGYSERSYFDVPCVQSGPPPCSQIILQYTRIIGNGHYMFKKQTPLTAEWFKTVTDNINSKYQALKKNPSRVPRQEYKHTFRLKDGTTFVSQYPFDWAEIANVHLVRAQYKFLDKIEANLPYVLMADYRTSNNLDQN